MRAFRSDQWGLIRFLLEALCIVAGAEFAVMLLLPVVAPGVTGWREAMLDASMLTLIAAPLLVWRARQWTAGSAESGGPIPSSRSDVSAWWAVVLFMVGVCLSLLVARGLSANQRQETESRFEQATTHIRDEVDDRFDRAVSGFNGLKSTMMMMARELNPQEFRTWVRSRFDGEGGLGIRGVGFIRRVSRDDLPDFTAHERAQGEPAFTVTTAGQATDLYVITRIEPRERNLPAWGYDIGSEAVRRQGVEEAVRSGKLTLTRRVTLLQDGLKRPGFLLFMPVYRSGAAIATPQEREAALLGLIYAPIVVDELLSGIGRELSGMVSFGLFDSPTLSRQSLLAGQWDEAVIHGRVGHLERRQVLEVGGQQLILDVDAMPAFEAGTARATPVWMGLLGLVLSGALALTVWLLRSGQHRAESLAERMTQDLQQAKQSAEMALRDSQALLHTLNQFSMVCLTSPDGTIVEVNDALCQASGYAREDLLGQNPRILGSGTHEPFFWIEVWQTLLHGHPWSGQLCNRTQGGQLYWTQCVIAPMLNGRGEVDKYISIAYDITETRRIQDELSANAERYNLAIDGGSDGLWDWMNVHSHEEWWSPQFFRLLGYEPNEIAADLVTFDQMLHPDQQQATFAAMEAAFRDYQPFDVEYQLRTKSGEYRWFRSRAKVFFDDFGVATRMAGSIQDIHDRKMAQAQIKEHSEQMAAIFSLSPDGFVSFDALGRVSYVSPAFTTLTSLPQAVLLGLDEGAFSLRLFEHAVEGQSVASIDDVRHHAGRVVLEMRPPARRMLEIRLSRGQGSAVSQVLAVRDVTHETEVDQMKSAFLSMAAHELRTPMSSIYGFTELLLTRELKPEKQKDLLGRIYRQSEAMVSIINELLDLARIEARQGKDFNFQQHSLADLVSQVIRDFKTPAGRSAPVVAWPEGPSQAWVDDKKMQQAVLNILSNAYKYSPEGGDVEVGFLTQAVGDRMQLGVFIQDHGLGLSPDQLARVGERFYRADKSGNIPGTGLGVTIVKEIMELMGGRIELSSQVGQGTRVTLWVPQLDLAQPEPVQTSIDLT